MDQLNIRVLHGQIKDFLADQRAAYNDKSPLERPAVLDDPKADPAQRAEAERQYTDALLQRQPQLLTSQEQKYLAAQVQRWLKSGDE